MPWGPWQSFPAVYTNPEGWMAGATANPNMDGDAYAAHIVTGTAEVVGGKWPAIDTGARASSWAAAPGAAGMTWASVNTWFGGVSFRGMGHQLFSYNYFAPPTGQYQTTLEQVVYSSYFSAVLDRAQLPTSPFNLGVTADYIQWPGVGFGEDRDGNQIDYHPDDDIEILSGAYYWVSAGPVSSTDGQTVGPSSPIFRYPVLRSAQGAGSDITPSWATDTALIKECPDEVNAGGTIWTPEEIDAGLAMGPIGVSYELNWGAAWDAATQSVRVRVLTNHLTGSAPPISFTGTGAPSTWFYGEDHVLANGFSGPLLKIQIPRFRVWEEGIPPLRMRARDDDTGAVSGGAEPATRILSGDTGSRDRNASVQRSRRIFYGPNSYA